MFHPSCPHCRSRKTIKYAFPRWKCTNEKEDCGRTFTLKNPDRRNRAALAGYVLDRSTYACLGERWKVNRSTAYRRVKRALLRRQTLLLRTKRFLHLCDGICLLDGKHLRIRGKTHTLFVAWDRGLGKPLHFILQAEGESSMGYWKLLTELKRIGYEPKGFVSDGWIGLRDFLKENYPNLPHQRCAVHLFMAMKNAVAPGKVRTDRSQEFVELMKLCIFSETHAEAEERYVKLYALKGALSFKERKALFMVGVGLHDCFIFADPAWKDLHLPRSSNAIENVMGQIEARLKTRRGTKSFSSLAILINEILLQVRIQITNR